jgi:hypothetical protein
VTYSSAPMCQYGELVNKGSYSVIRSLRSWRAPGIDRSMKLLLMFPELSLSR